MEPKLFRYAQKLEIHRTDGVLTPPSPLPHLYSVSYYQLSEELARTYPELTLPIFSGTNTSLVIIILTAVAVDAFHIKLMLFSECRGESEDPDGTSWWQTGDVALPAAVDEQCGVGRL